MLNNIKSILKSNQTHFLFGGAHPVHASSFSEPQPGANFGQNQEHNKNQNPCHQMLEKSKYATIAFATWLHPQTSLEKLTALPDL